MKKIISLLFISLCMGVSCTEEEPNTYAPPPPAVPDNGDGGNGDQNGEGEGGENKDEPVQLPAPKDVKLHSAFTETFDAKESSVFTYNSRGSDDFRYYPDFPSLSESRTDIMMLRLSPSDPDGDGPTFYTNDYAFYGTYSVRLKLPDIRKAQAKLGVTAEFSLFEIDEDYGLGSIYIDWRLADPEIVYLSTVTGKGTEVNTISRTINLAKGTIYNTSYKGEKEGSFTGNQNLPESIKALSGFDASKQFYTYGFDWKPDRITWWILDPNNNSKIVLWDYEGTKIFDKSLASAGIPLVPIRNKFNFWYDKDKPAQGMAESTQAPKYPFELEIDWIKYEPDEAAIQAWRDEHFKE